MTICSIIPSHLTQPPDTDIPIEELRAAVDQLLDNDVFDPEVGGLESLNRMTLSIVERTVII